MNADLPRRAVATRLVRRDDQFERVPAWQAAPPRRKAAVPMAKWLAARSAKGGS